MEIINNTVRDTTKLLNIPENLIVFSHLRWDFVYQRPQHLLSRFAQRFNISFLEEPIFDAPEEGYYSYAQRSEDILIIVPHLPAGLSAGAAKDLQKSLFDEFMKNKQPANYAFWYYTPMALEFTRKYIPDLIIYDCMDELSAFKFAPEKLKALEQELLNLSDIVFTGGHSLYEAKKNQHSNIYPFPSSIEKEHFLKVRAIKESFPPQKSNIKNPTLGFYGVIDERFDIDLIKEIADHRPNWNIVLIGPVVKIEPGMLPKNANIRYTGSKQYADLPSYMSGWDIALIPFLLNESTQFISPTKTPEYLAAGLPVISTPIKDVVSPYGKNQLVSIGSTAHDFILAAEKELAKSESEKDAWLKRVDKFLSQNSWDKTCSDMMLLVNGVMKQKSNTAIAQ